MDFNFLETTWKVLVIDDSKLNRLVIKKNLAKLKMSIDEATDGIEGLEALKNTNYDIILVDIIMPRMDGFGFLSKFREYTGNRFVPVILMTGSDDLNSKIKGLQIGADDFLVKPLNEKELVARVLSLLRLKYTHDELYKKNEQIKKELAIARKVQEFIVPKVFPDILYPSISARYLPIEDLGGDYFDCFTLPDDKIALLIADVVGHGIPAALIMTMTKMIFQIYSSQYHSSSEILTVINRNIKKLLIEGQYITAFYIIYDNKNKQIAFTNAGHPKALYYRKSKNSILALDTNGLFLGISDSPGYEQKILNVSEGDRIFLYTDGITEIKNMNNDIYGENKLARSIIRNSSLKGQVFCDAVISDLQAFAPIEKRNDDIAFLCAEF